MAQPSLAPTPSIGCRACVILITERGLTVVADARRDRLLVRHFLPLEQPEHDFQITHALRTTRRSRSSGVDTRDSHDAVSLLCAVHVSSLSLGNPVQIAAIIVIYACAPSSGANTRRNCIYFGISDLKKKKIMSLLTSHDVISLYSIFQ